MVALPTANDLEKLPLRALVAYASRAARRLSSAFRDDPAEATVNTALSLAESVVSAKSIPDVDIVCLMGAVAEIMEALAVDREHVEKHQAGFSLLCAASTAWLVVSVAAGSSVQSATRHAISSADAAARAAELLDEPQATRAIEAAHRDYLALLKKFGEQRKVVIGEAFDLAGMDAIEDLSEGQ